LAQWLASHHEPLILEELYTASVPPQPLCRFVASWKQTGAAAAVGILSREHLMGIMLLGPRLSGRIYGSTEQSALQVLCGQLAVAIENAELFTEVQNARIYNEILLQNLNYRSSSCRCRRPYYGIQPGSGTNRRLKYQRRRTNDSRPAGAVARYHSDYFDFGRAPGRPEVELRGAAGSTFARASSATFRGQGGELLGALMVVTDITAVKRLELQIRRSDRLASLGTLSAGMAHEIKNPLVSIKTFAQLLPERYHESDFRENLFQLNRARD